MICKSRTFWILNTTSHPRVCDPSGAALPSFIGLPAVLRRDSRGWSGPRFLREGDAMPMTSSGRSPRSCREFWPLSGPKRVAPKDRQPRGITRPKRDSGGEGRDEDDDEDDDVVEKRSARGARRPGTRRPGRGREGPRLPRPCSNKHGAPPPPPQPREGPGVLLHGVSVPRLRQVRGRRPERCRG